MGFELIYCSIAIREITSKDITDILNTARKFNDEHNITGCLLFHHREFLQILEGEEEVIKQLFKKINIDKRHCHPTLLHQGSLKERAFSSWSMAFKELKDVDMKQLKDILNLQEFSSLVTSLDNATTAKKLFKYFSQTILK